MQMECPGAGHAARTQSARQDDDVAEWRHGRPWLPEQPMDEADGHRPQGAAPHGERPESVRFQRAQP